VAPLKRIFLTHRHISLDGAGFCNTTGFAVPAHRPDDDIVFKVANLEKIHGSIRYDFLIMMPDYWLFATAPPWAILSSK